MFQLSLDFLGRQTSRFTSSRPKPVESNDPWVWKHGITVQLVRPPRARRYLLRLQADGTARLALPRRGSKAEALRFLERSEAWLLKQHALWLGRQKSRLPWSHGTRFLFRGEETLLQVADHGTGVQLRFADQQLLLKHPLPDYREAISRLLRRVATAELPVRTWELAKAHHITISRVTIRAQRSRWGSCSARGAISLNWRVIQAPVYVVDYLIIHELMHRREMNHSARYWKHVADACPGYREAEQWLKQTRLETLA